MINYLLEVPINSKNAKRRRFRADLSKLILSYTSETAHKDSIYRIFAEIIIAMCPDGHVIHAQPINNFVDIIDYIPVLEKHEMKYWLDSQFTKKIKKRPFLVTIQCECISNIVSIFNILQSESIVFFPSSHSEYNNDLEIQVLKCSTGNYEIPYLNEVEKYKYFTFFAESHMSLEILGLRNRILTCAVKVIDKESMYPHE